jgi:hypothetical protein
MRRFEVKCLRIVEERINGIILQVIELNLVGKVGFCIVMVIEELEDRRFKYFQH